MSISVKLLGAPCVVKDGRQITFPYRKAEGLFYYLCVKQTISRDEAVGIFWADHPEDAARKNLRDAVYHLKKLLGDNVIYSEKNNRIRLNKKLVSALDLCALNGDDLIEGYTEEFLEFFYVKNCFEFEAWTTQVREDLLRRCCTAVEKKVLLLSNGHDKKALLNCGTCLLRKHIYDEAHYIDIIKGLIHMGGYGEAEQLYQKLKTALSQELGIEPDAKLTDLMQEVLVLRSVHEAHTSADDPEEFFCGREGEILKLREAMSAHDVPAVLLTGEAGVGKTAIMQKFQSGIGDEQTILIAYQCVQPEVDLYLKPWNDILARAKEYCNAMEINSPPMLSTGGGQFDAPVYATQYELFAQTMLHALLQNPKGKKLVIMIDDIQWMDKESRRLLSSLIFWSKKRGILIVAATRYSKGENLRSMTTLLEAKGLLREIPVQRFTRDETVEIVSKCAHHLLRQPEVVEMIYQRSGGNALFLTEMIKEIGHTGNTKGISAKVTGMIQSRLLELPQEDREILDAISLFPRFATAQDLGGILRRPKIEILKSIERLILRQLLCLESHYNKMGYGFSHQVIREYVYDEIIQEKRQTLHEMVASYYEETYALKGDIDLCPMLIYHFNCCGNTIKLYTYQLEYLKTFYTPQHEIYPTITVEQSGIEQVFPRLGGEDVLIQLAEKVRLLNQTSPEVDALRMKVEFLLGRYDLFSGAFEKGLNNIRASIQAAKRLNDSRYLMDNYLQMVFYAITVHDLDMLDRYISKSEDLLGQYPYTDTDVYTVKRLRGVYWMKRQQFPRAEEIFQEIVEHTEPLYRTDPSYRIGLAACYNYLGESRQAAGDMDGALEYYLQSIACCSGERMVSGMGVMHSHAGYILYAQKRFDLAQEHIEKANECFAQCGALWGRAEAMSYAALLAIEKGKWEEAEKTIDSALTIAQRSGNPAVLCLVNMALALLTERRAK